MSFVKLPQKRYEILLVVGSGAGELGHGGKTVFPTIGEEYNSLKGANIYVFINKTFSKEGQAQMFAHEGYGQVVVLHKYQWGSQCIQTSD